MLQEIKRVISQWRSCLFPIQGPDGWNLDAGQWSLIRAARSSRARSRSPSHLTHLELASGALGSQEVLTLHDSLNSELGFLGKGKGDEGGSYAGRGRGRGEVVGDKEGCPGPAPLAAAGPEGGLGLDLRGAPTPRLGYSPGAHLSGTGLKAPLLGLGESSMTLKGRNCLPIRESSVSIREEG